MELPPTVTAFLELNLAIDVTSCSPALVPSMARGFAAYVRDNRITVFVQRREAVLLLQDLLISNQVAVVFCLPKTDQAIQIKGSQIQLSPAQESDLSLVQSRCDGFIGEVTEQGYERDLLQAYLQIDPAELVAISFSPREMYEQSPGALAGKLLGVIGGKAS